MATILDFGLMSNFSPIFTFIFIFAVLYGIFTSTKFLGNSKGLQALIALVVAILASISRRVVDIISFMTPWFVLLFFFVILVLLGFKVLGATDKDILSVVKGSRHGRSINWWIIIMSLIILISAISNTFGQPALQLSKPGENVTTDVQLADSGEGISPGEPGATATGSFQTNVYNTIFHPKVLGFVVILVIAALAIIQLTSRISR